MNGDKGVPLEERIDRLERRANVKRSRLLRAVDALDERRHRVEEIGHKARKLVKPVSAGLVGLAVLVGAGGYLLGRAIAARRRPRLAARAERFVEALSRPKGPSLGRQIAERALLSLVSYAATQVAVQARTALPADEAAPRGEPPPAPAKLVR